MVGESDVEVPKEFICPLSKEIMRDPVIIASGLTYERALIKQWLSENKTCPLTQQALDHSDVFPNVALKTLIRDWCSKHGIEPGSPPTDLSLSLDRIKLAGSPRGLPKSASEGRSSEEGSEDAPKRTLTDSSSAGGRTPRPIRKSTLGSGRRVSMQGDDPSPSPSPRSGTGQPPKARQGSGKASSSSSAGGRGSRPAALRGSSAMKIPAGGSSKEKRSPVSSESDDIDPVWQRTMSWDERVKDPEAGKQGDVAEGPEFRRQLSSASTIARVKKGVSKSASAGHSSGGNRIAALRGEAAAEAGHPLPPRGSGHSKPTSNDRRQGGNDGELPPRKSSSSSGSASGSAAKRNGPVKKTSSSSKGTKQSASSKPKSSGEKTREAAKSGSRRSGGGGSGGGSSRSSQRQGSSSASNTERRRSGLATSNSVADLLEAMDKGDKTERREASLRLRDVMRDSPGAMTRFLDYKDAAAIAVDMMDEAAEDLLSELEDEEGRRARGLGACEGHCDVLESMVGVIFQLCEDYDGAADVSDVGGIPAIVDVIDLPGMVDGGKGGDSNGRSSDSKEDRREALVTQVEFIKGTAAAALFALASWDDESEEEGEDGAALEPTDYRRAIRDAGAVPPLLALLRAEAARSRKDAALALFSLSHDLDCADEIVREGGVAVLVDLLNDKRAGVEEKAMAVLGNLVKEKEGQEALLAVEGILCILDVLESESERAREEALFALHHLVTTEAVDPALLLNDGALFPVAKMAQRKESPPEAMELYNRLMAARKGVAATS